VVVGLKGDSVKTPLGHSLANVTGDTIENLAGNAVLIRPVAALAEALLLAAPGHGNDFPAALRAGLGAALVLAAPVCWAGLLYLYARMTAADWTTPMLFLVWPCCRAPCSGFTNFSRPMPVALGLFGFPARPHRQGSCGSGAA